MLATAAGLAAAELVAGLISGAASPVVPVGQEFIDWTPKWLKNWAIEQFGTNDKAVLVAGALIVVMGLGVLVGIMMMRGQRTSAMMLTATIGVVGGWAVLIRPDPTLGKLAPTIVGTLVSMGVLWWLGPHPMAAAATGDQPDTGGAEPMAAEPMVAEPMVVDRRKFFTGAVAVGGVAAAAGGIGRMLQNRFEVDAERSQLALPTVDDTPTGAMSEFDLGVPGIESFVVPNDDFYRIDTALVVPQIKVDTWKLKIGGLVDTPLEFTFDDLLARPQIERYITLSCVSNPVGGDLVGNALWQGVLLRDILEEAGLQDGAEQVVSRSIDGWTCGSPIEAIMDGRDAMLAFGMNGEPLPARHGYPVRIVVPGLFGYVSATKWVTDIALTRWDDFDAYWIPRGWSKLGPVKSMARIDTPRSGSTQSGEVTIGGVAWAVHRGVSKVQVRVDEGEWHDAELGATPSADTWVQWAYSLDGVADGEHAIEVRAIDGSGEPQPETRAPVAPNGAQGYHRVTIDINNAS